MTPGFLDNEVESGVDLHLKSSGQCDGGARRGGYRLLNSNFHVQFARTWTQVELSVLCRVSWLAQTLLIL